MLQSWGLAHSTQFWLCWYTDDPLLFLKCSRVLLEYGVVVLPLTVLTSASTCRNIDAAIITTKVSINSVTFIGCGSSYRPIVLIHTVIAYETINARAAGGAVLRNSCATTDFCWKTLAVPLSFIAQKLAVTLVNLLGQIAVLSFQTCSCPGCSYSYGIWMETRAVPVQFTKPRHSS